MSFYLSHALCMNVASTDVINTHRLGKNFPLYEVEMKSHGAEFSPKIKGRNFEIHM